MQRQPRAERTAVACERGLTDDAQSLRGGHVGQDAVRPEAVHGHDVPRGGVAVAQQGVQHGGPAVPLRQPSGVLGLPGVQQSLGLVGGEFVPLLQRDREARRGGEVGGLVEAGVEPGGLCRGQRAVREAGRSAVHGFTEHAEELADAVGVRRVRQPVVVPVGDPVQQERGPGSAVDDAEARRSFTEPGGDGGVVAAPVEQQFACQRAGTVEGVPVGVPVPVGEGGGAGGVGGGAALAASGCEEEGGLLVTVGLGEAASGRRRQDEEAVAGEGRSTTW